MSCIWYKIKEKFWTWYYDYPNGGMMWAAISGCFIAILICYFLGII